MNLHSTFLFLSLSALTSFSGASFGQVDVDKPIHMNLSVGGNFALGNLNQAQAFANGRFSYSGNDVGVDIIANGFRFWLQPNGQNVWHQVGDDLSAMAYPYYYLRPNFFVHALARYETSQLHQLTSRTLAGGGVGFSPLRSANQNLFLRLSLGGYGEQAVFPGTDLTRDVPHEKGIRTVARLGLLSNGHFAAADQTFRARYLFFCFVDPHIPRDLRLGIDSNLDFRIWGPLSFRINALWSYNAVVLTSVQPYDFRATFGLGWDFRG